MHTKLDHSADCPWLEPVVECMNKNNFEALGDIMTGKIFNLKRKAYGGRQGQYLSRFASVLHDPDYGFYVEDYFNDLLRMERKRTERSRKPFLLMLMDVTGLSLIHI